MLYCTVIDILEGLFLLLKQNPLSISDTGHWAIGALCCPSISDFKLFFLSINLFLGEILILCFECLLNAYLNICLISI